MIQLQVLNKILFEKDVSLITLNNLNSDYFSDYKDEFNFIKDHYEKYGKTPDLATFKEKFPSFDIIEVEEKDSYLIEELCRDKNARSVAYTFNEIRALLKNGEVDKALDMYKKGVENISTGVALESVDIIHDTSRYDAYIERTKDFEKYYVKTGFKELDDLIGGWDREEELATIVARTNVGKSFALFKSAVAALTQGLTVGIYSGEMSEKKVGYRIDTLLSHISNGALTHGNENVKDQYEKYIQELPKKYKNGMKVLTPKMINGPAGVNALRTFIEKEKLDILFIDQHSLLEDDRKAKTPVEKASNISKDLKNLQVMKRIPIITVSQQNRTKGEEEDKVDTTQIAMSDRIAQDSTTIIGITRDKKDQHIMTFHLVKCRDGENGKKLTYYTDLNTGTFTFIPSEESSDGKECDKSRYESSTLNDTLSEDEPF